MQTTFLKYMEESHLYTDTAQIIDISDHEDGRKQAILDQTIFYPQGGGQPYDQGKITNDNGTFHVEEVRFVDGHVYHIGTISGDIASGDQVSLEIDQARRVENAKLHTTGHLIDEAVNNLDYGWHPTKGCHFPGQCFVEYEGDPLKENIDYSQTIQEEVNRLIQHGYTTKAQFADTTELDDICRFTLPNMPTDKPTRVVFVWGEKAVPCGGTHIDEIGNIGTVEIKKVKHKKGAIKVSYELVD